MIAVGFIGNTKLICFDNGLILRFNRRSKKWTVCVGTKNHDGYLTMGIDCKAYMCHRVVGHAFGILGIDSPLEIDHINTIRNDNRICNLRPATRQENNFNKIAKGYTWCNRSKKWLSQICLNRKKIHLGYFDTKEASYQTAKLKYHIFKVR